MEHYWKHSTGHSETNSLSCVHLPAVGTHFSDLWGLLCITQEHTEGQLPGLFPKVPEGLAVAGPHVR